MGSFSKGNIVLFPFPYTNLSERKIRPCLVISDEMQEDLILCQITSKQLAAGNYSIELNKDETIGGNLMIDSYIRCNMIFTASKDQIIKKICEISNSKYNTVINKIVEIIEK